MDENNLTIIYAEIDGLAIDENGQPCPAGVRVTISSGLIKDSDYTATALSEITGIEREQIHLLSESEYLELYGDDDDDYDERD